MRDIRVRSIASCSATLFLLACAGDPAAELAAQLTATAAAVDAANGHKTAPLGWPRKKFGNLGAERETLFLKNGKQLTAYRRKDQTVKVGDQAFNRRIWMFDTLDRLKSYEIQEIGEAVSWCEAAAGELSDLYGPPTTVPSAAARVWAGSDVRVVWKLVRDPDSGRSLCSIRWHHRDITR